eukprot:scaffold37804_cov62-Attheya_sp.AAC.2
MKEITKDDKSLVEQVSTELISIMIHPMSYEMQSKLDTLRSNLEEESQVEGKGKPEKSKKEEDKNTESKNSKEKRKREVAKYAKEHHQDMETSTSCNHFGMNKGQG